MSAFMSAFMSARICAHVGVHFDVHGGVHIVVPGNGSIYPVRINSNSQF